MNSYVLPTVIKHAYNDNVPDNVPEGITVRAYNEPGYDITRFYITSQLFAEGFIEGVEFVKHAEQFAELLDLKVKQAALVLADELEAKAEELRSWAS